MPFCTYQAKGAVFGRKRKEPSTKGRDEREKAHMAQHKWCEACLTRPSQECHHLARRGLGGWNRKNSPLLALCAECHRLEHEGKLDLSTLTS